MKRRDYSKDKKTFIFKDDFEYITSLYYHNKPEVGRFLKALHAQGQTQGSITYEDVYQLISKGLGHPIPE